jgi:hypothetical protein
MPPVPLELSFIIPSLLIWYLMRSLRRGSLFFNGITWSRSDDPIFFWLFYGALWVCAIGMTVSIFVMLNFN